MATFEHLRNDKYTITPIDHPDIEVGPGEVFDVDDDTLAASLRDQPDNFREITDGANRSSVDEVLADVDGDPDRARVALALEQDQPKPRKTLVSRLEEIVASSEENVS